MSKASMNSSFPVRRIVHRVLPILKVAKLAYPLCAACVLFMPNLSFGAEQTEPGDYPPWPRVRATNGNTVTVYLPQVESWSSNSFLARAAVEVKLAEAKSALLGAVWFEAYGTVDRTNRLMTIDR